MSLGERIEDALTLGVVLAWLAYLGTGLFLAIVKALVGT